MATTIDNNILRELVLKYGEKLNKYGGIEDEYFNSDEDINFVNLVNSRYHELETTKGEVGNYHTITQEEFFEILTDKADINTVGSAGIALEEGEGFDNK